MELITKSAKPQKSKGKRKTQDPCEVCFLHRRLCLCADIPTLIFKTRLSLIVHAKELKRTTNTGSLAAKALTNSQIFVRGRIGVPLDLTNALSPHYRHVVFFPSDDAIELSNDFAFASALPINLIVPDGNWRQASKIPSRQKELLNLPRVKITEVNTGTQHLRAETSEFGMATLQAIAHAFGFLEGPEAREKLLKLYELKLSRTLKGRGFKESI